MATKPKGAKKPTANANGGNGATEPNVASTSEPPDRFASGCDFLLANGAVDEKLYSQVIRSLVAGATPHKTIVLCLVTYGGVANDGFRIGRVLQALYDDVVIFIPSFCKSAGTLVACAANTIVMSPFGELGPLDVQLLKRDELFERRSGLITTYALEELKQHSFDLFQHFMLSMKMHGGSISLKMAADIASRVTSDIMKNVYQNINVESIGEDARNLRVASEYCERLDKKFGNLKSEGIQKLVRGYVSHDFVIDGAEAASLFNRVEIPTKTLRALLAANRAEMVKPKVTDSVVRMLTPPVLNANVIQDGGATDGSQDGVARPANGATAVKSTARPNAPR